MTVVRSYAQATLVAAALAGCSSSPRERLDSAELTRLASLKQRYPNVVMGFDIRPETTLIVSLDLQHFMEMDDDAVDVLKRDVLEAWRSAWACAHPHQHAALHVLLIDFIGRKVAEESTKE